MKTTTTTTEKETQKNRRKFSREQQRHSESLGPGPRVCPAAGGRSCIFPVPGNNLRTGCERGTGVSSHGSQLGLQAGRDRGCCEQSWGPGPEGGRAGVRAPGAKGLGTGARTLESEGRGAGGPDSWVWRRRGWGRDSWVPERRRRRRRRG